MPSAAVAAHDVGDLLCGTLLMLQRLTRENQACRIALALDRRLPRHGRLDHIARTPQLVVRDQAQGGVRADLPDGSGPTQ